MSGPWPASPWRTARRRRDEQTHGTGAAQPRLAAPPAHHPPACERLFALPDQLALFLSVGGACPLTLGAAVPLLGCPPQLFSQPHLTPPRGLSSVSVPQGTFPTPPDLVGPHPRGSMVSCAALGHGPRARLSHLLNSMTSHPWFPFLPGAERKAWYIRDLP